MEAWRGEARQLFFRIEKFSDQARFAARVGGRTGCGDGGSATEGEGADGAL